MKCFFKTDFDEYKNDENNVESPREQISRYHTKSFNSIGDIRRKRRMVKSMDGGFNLNRNCRRNKKLKIDIPEFLEH